MRGAARRLARPRGVAGGLSVAGWIVLAIVPVSVPVLVIVPAVGCVAESQVAAQGEVAPVAAVRVEARVDKAVATTGDVITYELVVEHRQDVVVDVPEQGAAIAGLRIVDASRDAGEDDSGRAPLPEGFVRDRRLYRLRADLVGSYVVPEVVVRWKEGDVAHEARASQIFIEVASVLPEGGEVGELRDIKPLEPLPQRPLWPWLAGGVAGLALLAALGFYLWRRPKVGPPPRPAHEVAFAALDALRRTDFDDPVALRRYFFSISEVLRAYVEARFALNATDLTTEEILVRLRDSAVPEAPRLDLRDFLIATDEVKFAGRPANRQTIESTYERALRFVETTVPPPESSAPGAGQAPPAPPTGHAAPGAP